MKAETILEILAAAHISRFVSGPEVFQHRGGIFIVGPPGILKTSFIGISLGSCPDALILSDLNVQTMGKLRDDLISGRYSTLAFTAYEKLYQRHSSTSSNVEGHISALVEEGFTRTSFEDQRGAAMKARALVVGAMPYTFYKHKIGDWIDSGFARRFLWFFIGRLHQENAVTDAIIAWQPLEFGKKFVLSFPTSRHIPYNMSEADSRFICTLLNEQEGHAGVAHTLLKKIACALMWKHNYRQMKEIMEDCRKSLSRAGDVLIL